MFCPVCRGEYREGVTSCYDCEADLVDKLTDADPRAAARDPEVDARSRGELAGPLAHMAGFVRSAFQRISSLFKLEGAEPIDKGIFWVIVLVGLALPWITGASVKLYLDARGEPTLPWSTFFDGCLLLFLIPVAIWWSGPHLALALLWRVTVIRTAFLGTVYWERLVVVACGFTAGTLAAIDFFIEAFLSFDVIIFIIPTLPMSWAVPMTMGLFLGCAIVFPNWLRRHRSRIPR